MLRHVVNVLDDGKLYVRQIDTFGVVIRNTSGIIISPEDLYASIEVLIQLGAIKLDYMSQNIRYVSLKPGSKQSGEVGAGEQGVADQRD